MNTLVYMPDGLGMVGEYVPGVVSVSLVGSAARAALGLAQRPPSDVDLVVLLRGRGRVPSELMARVRRLVASLVGGACKDCPVYVASPTYSRQVLSRGGVYVMLYTLEDYASRVSPLLRASWARESLTLYGEDLAAIDYPEVRPGDVMRDFYGISGCLAALAEGYYVSRPLILGPGDAEPAKYSVRLDGPALRRLAGYCLGWAAHNALRALGWDEAPAPGEPGLERLAVEALGWDPRLPPRLPPGPAGRALVAARLARLTRLVAG